MNNLLTRLPFLAHAIWFIALCLQPQELSAADPGAAGHDSLQYHAIQTDAAGNLISWVSPDPGKAYDAVIRLVWTFWKGMETDSNGLKYYMNHMIWNPEHDEKGEDGALLQVAREGPLASRHNEGGLGGDQLSMALSSWRLLYAYTGDPAVIENMKYIADEYLARALSRPEDAWPDLPYPYNTDVHSGRYDGDMIMGSGYTMPDKAGSFGFELVNLYKMTGDQRYLKAAVEIANTLAKHTRPGDGERSPLPFKVNAVTGEVGFLRTQTDRKNLNRAECTSNWTGTLELFAELLRLKQGDTAAYSQAFDLLLNWMKAYPLKTNKWGPFFEDCAGWSDTQINAVTFAMYIMEHPELFDHWKVEARGILDWAWTTLGNQEWQKYGVTVINEQTVYRVPGNSHTSRQASMELLYCEKTGDRSTLTNAIRALNWATYTVAENGRNRYYRDYIWLTDGYGDYIRHYLRAMAAMPELAPADADHLLRTSSVVTRIAYGPGSVSYTVFDPGSRDVLRLTSKPRQITVEGSVLPEGAPGSQPGWTWQPLENGGVLRLQQNSGRTVKIEKQARPPAQ